MKVVSTSTRVGNGASVSADYLELVGWQKLHSGNKFKHGNGTKSHDFMATSRLRLEIGRRPICTIFSSMNDYSGIIFSS